MLAPMCLSLALVAGATQDELPANWKVTVSKEGGFSIAMPGMPTEKKQTVKTATGQLQVNVLVAEGRSETLFVVSYSDFAESELKKVEKRLDQARDGAVSSARGKLRSEKSIELDGHAGREFVIEKDGEPIARMRIYLVKNRLYQVVVLGNGSALASKEVPTFLESFRLKI